MNTFKQPLSSEEESQYLALAKQGDLHARNLLVEYNLRLVAHIAKKYYSPDRDSDDLLSIGTIGLIKAVNTFDSKKGNRLVTYASRCIENELLMRLRQERKESKEVSIYEPIGTDKEGNEISLLDIISCDDDNMITNLIAQENLQQISKLFSSILTSKEQRVIALRYGLFGCKELTQREVASLLNISRSYVSRIEKKALLKLRSALIL
ncbi:MAG: RNA polymerase sporulation sigma factor SigK [Lachnospiraceae bacterium]|nr:RNA polymerase sporulation sigma factor SigK [Lachnospiraceae bacterium]